MALLLLYLYSRCKDNVDRSLAAAAQQPSVRESRLTAEYRVHSAVTVMFCDSVPRL